MPVQMRVFDPIFRHAGRPPTNRWPIGADARSPIGPGRAGRLPRASAEDGFLLIEVMISALLVALVVVATFNGFDLVNRTNANERDRTEANLLAAKSQEELRTEPASALEQLSEKGAAGNKFTTKVNGTTFTVTQTAEDVKGSGQTSSCTATEQASSTAPNMRITSSVRWPQLGERPAVSQQSVITPPLGSALEVDVVNGEPASAGVSGVTAVIKYTPTESGSVVTREGTTGAAGCILFGHIRATAVTLEIDEKPNFVTPTGALKVSPAEVEIAPNITTHHQVVYNEGGAIEAEFTVNGETEFHGKKVMGDTFVVYNELLNPEPHYQLGSTQFRYEAAGEEHYTALTAGTPNGAVITPYATTAKTATGAKYTFGDLFPFPTHEWVAYAGDCGENNAELITKEAVKDGHGLVKAGETTKVDVPLSYDNITIHKGTLSSPSAELLSTAYAVTITNTGCEKALVPNNAAAFSYEHLQSTKEGALEDPFQPFGAFQLCLQVSSPLRRILLNYDNTASESAAMLLYPEEKAQAEVRAARETEEAATRKTREEKEKATKESREASEAKTRKAREEKEATAKAKRESEEAPAKASRESEETKQRETREKEEAAKKAKETEEKSTKEKDEKEEKTTREKWEKERKEGKITKAQQETKEKEQKTTRESREKTEKTNKEKREKEEAPAREAREKEEASTKSKRESEESSRKSAESSEASARKAAEGEEKTAREKAEKEEKTAKEKAVEEEASARTVKEQAETKEEEARTKAGVAVESGKSCP